MSSKSSTTFTFDVDALLNRVVPAQLIKELRTSGRVATVKAVIEHVERLQDQLALDEHHKRVEALAESPESFARYLGSLGTGRRILREELAREPTSTEIKAYEAGRRQRRLELRALQLDRALHGRGGIEPWMEST